MVFGSSFFTPWRRNRGKKRILIEAVQCLAAENAKRMKENIEMKEQLDELKDLVDSKEAHISKLELLIRNPKQIHNKKKESLYAALEQEKLELELDEHSERVQVGLLKEKIVSNETQLVFLEHREDGKQHDNSAIVGVDSEKIKNVEIQCTVPGDEDLAVELTKQKNKPRFSFKIVKLDSEQPQEAEVQCISLGEESPAVDLGQNNTKKAVDVVELLADGVKHISLGGQETVFDGDTWTCRNKNETAFKTTKFDEKRTRTADWFSLKDEEEPAQTHRVELEDSQFGAPSGKINNSEVAKKETLDNKEAMPEMQKKNADAQIQRKNDIVAKLHQKAESVLKFEGSCEEARSLLAKAVAIEETGRNDNVYLADLWYLIGVSYRREKEFNKMVESYTKAIGHDPQSAYLFYWRAVVYDHIGSYKEAAQDLERAIELSPQDECAQYMLALVKKKLPPM